MLDSFAHIPDVDAPVPSIHRQCHQRDSGTHLAQFFSHQPAHVIEAVVTFEGHLQIVRPNPIGSHPNTEVFQRFLISLI